MSIQGVRIQIIEFTTITSEHFLWYTAVPSHIDSHFELSWEQFTNTDLR